MTTDTQENFLDLGLEKTLNDQLIQRGILSPSAIQKLVFRPVVEGKSVLGLSKTGSGKTLAYLLPLVQRQFSMPQPPVDNLRTEDQLKNEAPQHPSERTRVLILCPTRELAHQIHSEVLALVPNQPKASLLIVGGDSEEEQLKGFEKSHFLVATPGRLLDLIKNSHLPLGSVHRVVLDEADRLLDMGFQEDIRDILGRIPKGFQLVCLSATLHLGVEELIYEMGVDFVRVNASSDADLTVDGLDHRVAFVGDTEKFHFLANFLKDKQDQRGIVFSNFREAAHRISKRLEGLGYRAEALSAQLSQPQRRKIMENFRAEKLDILVASDVAARGLDVDALDYVINFELPDDSATYVHRVGRTARAGRKGIAISLVGFEDSFRLEKLETYLKQPISRFEVNMTWLEGPLPRGKFSPNASAPRGDFSPRSQSQGESRPYSGGNPHRNHNNRKAQPARTQASPQPVRSPSPAAVSLDAKPAKKTTFGKVIEWVSALFKPKKANESATKPVANSEKISMSSRTAYQGRSRQGQGRDGARRGNRRRPPGRARPAGPRRDGDR